MPLSPYQRVAIICCVITFSTGYSQSYIFTYLPEMTLWMGYTEVDKAFYASAAMLTFFAGVFLTNYPLALLSDTRGHRNVITLLMVVSSAVNLFMMLSRDMYSLLILRFFAGTGFTVLALSRAVVSVVCSDSEQAQAMSIILTGYLTGITVGSVLGGYLVSFAVRYPETFGDSVIFTTFPYIIPPLIALLSSMLAASITFGLYPKESIEPHEELSDVIDTISQNEQTHLTAILHGHTQKQYASINIQNGCVRHLCSVKSDIDTNAIASHFKEVTELTTPHKLGAGSTEHGITIDKHDTGSNTPDKHETDCRISPTNDDRQAVISRVDDKQTQGSIKSTNLREYLTHVIRESTLIKLLKAIKVLKAVASYALLAISMNLYLELFPVWASLPVYLGGIAYATDDIGTVLAVITITGSIAQLLLHPIIERRYGPMKSFVGFAVAMMIAITLTPLTRFLTHSTLQWVCVVGLQFVVRLSEGAGICAVITILNASVLTSQAGAANGLTMMANGIGTVVVSQCGGEMFTWSITSPVGSPVDVSLMFVYMGIHCTVAAAIVYSTSKL